MITIKRIVVNLFRVQTYIVYDKNQNCVLIDPGCQTRNEQKDIEHFIEENELKVTSIWQTHLHFDHILSTAYFARLYHVEPVCHHDDLTMLDVNKAMAIQWGIDVNNDDYKYKVFVNDGDILKIGDDEFRVIHVPGHSIGSVAYYSETNKVCFSGDALFRLSIGRTDLPSGNETQLINSIQQKLFTLPDDTYVCAGHGQDTSIGFERANNLYVKI